MDKAKDFKWKKQCPKCYFYGVVNCFMEQAHKSHRPQNIITKCTWHQLQEALISLIHILPRSYKLWEIGNAYISPLWIANHIPLTTAFIIGMVLSTPYTTLRVTPFMSQGNVFFLSELALQKTIHLLSNLCFCPIGPVFPVTLCFSKCLLGVHGASWELFRESPRGKLCS